MPELSKHFQSREPSAVRVAHIEFHKRTDKVKAIDCSIGNVSLPLPPAMKRRLAEMKNYFKEGIIKYTDTQGTEEAQAAFLNVISASGFATKNLNVLITDGGSQAMELAIIGCCDKDGRPLLVIDPTYPNYKGFAERTGRKIVSLQRSLEENGKFTLPDVKEIKAIIKRHQPAAMVVIPYDNPTGQFYPQERINELAKICVENDLWLISDEAYRELHYTGNAPSSIWGVEIPGIEGRRISIESSSKVWNACGIRTGGLVTDNPEFYEKAVNEYTSNLAPNALGQYLFGALAEEDIKELQKWFEKQREYYKKLMVELTLKLKEKLPGIIVSLPQASIYSVIDVRKIAKPGFDAKEFVLYCTKEGQVKVQGKEMTLLVSPLAGFYNMEGKNPGQTQMRISYVAPPEEMKLVPELFSRLFKEFERRR